MADAIEIRYDSRDLARWRAFQRSQLPFALSLAANLLAQRVRSNERKTMTRRLDRPTPFTLNSLYLKPGNKRRPEARVWFKDFAPKGAPAGRYLMPQVHGGGRRVKGMERALIAAGKMRQGEYLIPTKDAPKDPYGNVPRGVITRILSGVRAFSEVGFQANASQSRRSRAKGNAERYFVGTIDGVRGIWERVQLGFGTGVRPLFLIVERDPKYRKRFPFFAVAENTMRAHSEATFKTAMAQALATARR